MGASAPSGRDDTPVQPPTPSPRPQRRRQWRRRGVTLLRRSAQWGPSPPTRTALLLALPLSRAPRASLRVRAWQHAGVAAAMRVYQSFAGAIRPASCSASKPSRGREQIGAPPKARAGLSLARAACRCDPFLSCSVVEGVCAQKACRKMRRGGHSAQLRTLAQVRNKRQIRGSARALACAIAA